MACAFSRRVTCWRSETLMRTRESMVMCAPVFVGARTILHAPIVCQARTIVNFPLLHENLKPPVTRADATGVSLCFQEGPGGPGSIAKGGSNSAPASMSLLDISVFDTLAAVLFAL